MKLLLTCERVDDNLVIQNAFYKVSLSYNHGGSIRGFEFNGVDLGVTREGCEYWEPDNPNHYEQEFSPTTEIEVIDKNDEFVMLKVTARLVSPQLKTDGGSCAVRWLFRDNSPIIYTDYQVFPSYPYGKADRYVCFAVNAHNRYSMMMDEIVLGEIGAGDSSADGWWRKTGVKAKWGTVENNQVGLLFMGSPRLTSLTIFKSDSMMELKMDESFNSQLGERPTHSFYFPYEAKSTAPLDETLFREAHLKAVLVNQCKEMGKEDLSADWFNRTLKDHNRGIWLLNNKNRCLRKGDKVLDIGGGIGAWGAYLNYVIGLDLDYVNADVVPIRVETSKKIFAELGIKGRFIVSDWKNIHTEKQDVVLCFGALHYFDKDIFKIANRSLKKNGVFVFEVAEKSPTCPEDYQYALTMSEVELELKNAGFESLKIEYCAEYSSFNDIVVISRKKRNSFYTKDYREHIALRELANGIIKGEASVLSKVTKLSVYCKDTIDFPSKMPEGREWYEATGYESLTKWKIGNCLNYANSLISLANSIDIDGRTIWIMGDCDDHDEPQGHVLCELLINGKWVLFDAMFGVPLLGGDDPQLSSAYECWKNPDLYIDSIDPKHYGHSREFWHQIWSDFSIHPGKTIKEVGENAFVKQWYSLGVNEEERRWYVEFRGRILSATDEELPLLYEELYREYLYKIKGHHPHEELIPISQEGGALTIIDIPNTYRLVRFLIKQIREDGKVLELGCGATGFPFILVTDGYDVTATDMRKKIIENQQKFIKLLPEDIQSQIRFDCTLAEDLPYQDGAFDIIVGVDFIEHIRNLGRLLEECCRVLKPSGKMYFATPLLGINASPEHLYNFTRENLETTFKSYGLSIKIYLERYYWGNMKPNALIVEVAKRV